MVTQWLSTHKDVRCLPAIFSEPGWPSGEVHGRGVFAWIRETLDPEWNVLARRIARPNKLLREIAARSSDKLAVGFKHHLNESEFNEFLLGSGFRKIILTRNNMLAAYSSHKVVELTGQGAARAGSTVIRAKASFDPGEFSSFRKKRARFYEHARQAARKSWKEIDYTAARTEEGMAEIGRFLGVDPAGFGPAQTAKRNSDDIVSRFSNPDQVRSYLEMNHLEHWTTEG